MSIISDIERMKAHMLKQNIEPKFVDLTADQYRQLLSEADRTVMLPIDKLEKPIPYEMVAGLKIRIIEEG